MKIRRFLSAFLAVCMIVAMLSINLGSSAERLSNSAPTFLALGENMSFMTNTYEVQNHQATGVTMWLRVTGAKEPFSLYEMKMTVYTRDYPGGVSTWNHGQDGSRNAEWEITQDGDWLFWIPFKHYTLNHQFVGDDYVTGFTNYTLSAATVSAENKGAKVALMGIFDGKFEKFNTTFVDGSSEQKVEGTYEYKNAQLSRNAANAGIISPEYYDPDLGGVRHTDDPDSPYDGPIDYSDQVVKTWVYAFANSPMPEPAYEGDPGEFDGWYDAAEGGSPMIARENNTLWARYSQKYTVTFYDEDKKNELGTCTVKSGTAATAPSDPKKASDQYYTYAFAGWVNEDGTKADFSKVTEDVSVYASYTATFINPYEDADLSRYYGKAVEYVTVNGIMNGTDATHFGPNGTATRGMIVTVLYRMEGSPSVAGMKNPFDDVESGKYYTDAVIWASNTGVVNGTGEGKFSPGNNVTREQFATMLYRYADQIKGYYMSSGSAALSGFVDKNDISTYAINAVKWAIATADHMSGQGIRYYNKVAYIEGVPADEKTVKMNPKGNATRGQMATILERFINSEHLTKES